MDCRKIQDRLLESDDPRHAASDGPLAGHVGDCAACRRLAEQLAGLEQSWRSLPDPPRAEAAKQTFLARLPASGPDAPAPLSAGVLSAALHLRPTSRRHMLRWCAASAASLLAVGTGAWLLVSEQQARAGDDLVDRLVDWNLRLTQTESSDDRGRLYRDESDRLHTLLSKQTPAPEQSELALALFENGRWLASHHDPLSEADRFDGLADRLLRHVSEANVKGNARRMNRLLAQYNRVLESGVDLNVSRVESRGVLDLERQRRLERLALGDPERLAQLAALLETAPDATRREIQRALGIHRKHAKKAGHSKTPRAKPAKKETRNDPT